MIYKFYSINIRICKWERDTGIKKQWGGDWGFCTVDFFFNIQNNSGDYNGKDFVMWKFLLPLIALFPMGAVANPACPVCTIAVGVGLDIARRLGVPDSVVGLWAGALLTLLGYWFLKFMDKKNWHFRGRNTIVILASVAMIGFVYLGTVKYNPVSICGLFAMDPVLFGAICGMFIFVLTGKLYQWMKNKNGGHAHFPFEKVVLPLVALALASWAMMICF